MLKKMSCIILSFLLIAGLNLSDIQIASAAKPMLNYSSYRIYGYYSFQLVLRNNSKKVKWSSSKTQVAKVTRNGKVSSVSNGNCVITATVGGKKYRCKVKVTGLLSIGKKRAEQTYTKTTLDLQKLKIDLSAIRYNQEGNAVISNVKVNSITLKLFNVPKKKGKKLPIKWKSSKKSIARVNQSGKITPRKKGKCTIYALVKGKKYSCKVYVTDYNKTVRNHQKGDLDSAAEKIDKQNNIYKIYQMVNRARLEKKISPLSLDSALNDIAEIRVKECFPKKVEINESTGVSLKLDSNFSHVRPDGTAYYTAYDDYGFSFPAHYSTGENIAHSSDRNDCLASVTKRTFDSLWASETHKRNMLRKEFTRIGIGYYKAARFSTESGITFVDSFWTQEFFGIA